MWDQVPNPKGSWVRTFQETFQKYASFAPPFFHGRGVFQYDFGIVPHRRVLTCVVGTPIACEKVEEPSQAQVLALQKIYLDALSSLFKEHKEKYAPSGELVFAE